MPVEQFDYSRLDKPEDYIKEAVSEGREVMPIVMAMVRQREAEIRREGAVAILSEIVESDNPKRMAMVMCVAAGVNLVMGKSGPQIAKELRITKQALQQAVERFRRRMGLPKTRTMRSEAARKAMAEAWSAHHGGSGTK